MALFLDHCFFDKNNLSKKIINNSIRPHLASGDIISDQAYNSSFFVKLESIQYNAALTITVEILQNNNCIKS